MPNMKSMTRWASAALRRARIGGDKLLANNMAKWGIIGGGAGLFLASRMSDNSWIRGAGNIAGLGAAGLGGWWGARAMGYGGKNLASKSMRGFTNKNFMTKSPDVIAAATPTATVASTSPGLSQRLNQVIGRAFKTAPVGSRLNIIAGEDISVTTRRAPKSVRMAGNERRRASTNDLVSEYHSRMGL